MAGWADGVAGRNVLATGLILCAVLGGRQAGADPPPVPEQSEPDVAPLAEPGWHPALDRRRSVDQGLDRIRRDLLQDQYHDALALLQAILDEDSDVFVPGDSGLPLGARSAALSALLTAPPEARRLYSTLYDGQAAQLLADKSTSELARLESVVRRFFCTPTGGQACLRLAESATDRGDWTRAAHFWRLLQADRVHRKLLTGGAQKRAEMCFHLTGEPNTGGIVSTPRVMLRPPRAAVAGPAACSMPAPTATPPVAIHPVWRIPVVGGATKAFQEFLSNWENAQMSRAQPIATGNHPLVVGSQLVFRDLEGVRSIDPVTQAVRWHYTAESGLQKLGNGDSADGVDPALVTKLWTTNQLQGLLSSDGARVFTIDQLEWRWNGSTPSGAEIDLIAAARQVNTLLAIEAHGLTAGSVRWVAGGPDHTQATLAGHFFLGPPVPHEGRLYVMAEHKHEILLACLDGDNGRVHWTQTLCLVQVPIAHDLQRYHLAAVPVIASGLVICPTQGGVLVAVEAVTGSLRWACAHDDTEQLERLATWPLASRKRYEHPAVVNGPIVSSERIVFLPPQADQLFCVDLKTGKPLWKSPREDNESSMEYVGATIGDIVIVVGRRGCRGLSLADGHELWSRPLGSSPSGRGVRIGERYVVPLSDSRLVCLDAASGRPCGLTRPNSEIRPGNLLVCGDLVISQGTTHLTALRQAGAWLRKMETTLDAQPVAPVLQAELKLALNDMPAAKTQLREIANASSAETPTARALLRAVLFAEFWADPNVAERSLAELEAISDAPEDRARLLVRKAQWQFAHGEIREPLESLAQVMDLELAEPLAVEENQGRELAPEAWARGHLAAMHRETDPGVRRQIANFVVAQLRTAVRDGDLAKLRRWVRASADLPEAEPFRLALAKQLAQAGQSHETEMQLLVARRSSDPHCLAGATRLLSELVLSRGLPHESARLLAELRDLPEEAPSRVTTAAYVPERPRDEIVTLAMARLTPPHWLESASRGQRPGRVQIRQDTGLGQQLHAGNYPVQGKIRSTPRGFPYQLFDREKSSGGELVLVDRTHGGVLPGTIAVPPRYSYPVSADQSFVGRFLPIGSQGMAHGISLLEQRMVWSTAPRGLNPVNDIVRVGPAGPDFAVFQCWHHLFVLDPADGHVLWHRDDLAGNSGLMTDPYAGILADETVLAVFDSDRMGYLVYDMATGAERRRGKLDIDLRQTRRVYGRRLFHYTREAENRRIRVWDVATDTCTWDEPVDRLQDSAPQAGFRPGAKLCTFVSESNEIAYVSVDNHVRVFDAPTGETRLDIAMDPEELQQVGAIRVFGDEARYYVNLQHWPPPAGQNSFLATDTLVPAAHIQGDLYAWDRATGELAWQRDLENRTVLMLAEYRLPLLVTFCRLRNNAQMTLEMEVISGPTGQTLAHRADLQTDQVLQCGYHRDPTRITLRGAKSTVTIDFTPPGGGVQTAEREEPLRR